MAVCLFALNDVTYDSRVHRVAGSFAAAGYDVTLYALPPDGGPRDVATETVDGYRIVFVPLPSEWRRWWVLARDPRKQREFLSRTFKAGWWRKWRGWRRAAAVVVAAPFAAAWRLVLARDAQIRARKGNAYGPVGDIGTLARWHFDFAGLGRRIAPLTPRAPVFLALGLEGLSAALAARRHHGGGAVVYDAHEILFDAPGYAPRSAWTRSVLRRAERRMAGQVDALVTVNEALAGVLARRLRVRRVLVVHNCPPRWSPPADLPDVLRPALGLAPGTPLVLYHGGLYEQRGIEQLMQAMLEPPLLAAHAVFLGYGPLRADVEAAAVDPRFGGRIHMLDAVPRAHLLDTIAAADVDVMPLQPPSLNNLLATPNKLFESLAAGVPVVVSDFPGMRPIVMDDPAGPLGAVCDPTNPVSIAAAVAAVIGRDSDERAALRARCLDAAHGRWNWETEVRGLLELHAELLLSMGN
jgi:glycosyltransferase involved in cell wall biosynthesis